MMPDDGPIQVLVLEADAVLAGAYARLVVRLATHRLVGAVATVDSALDALRRRPVDILVIGTTVDLAEATFLLRRLRSANAPLDVIVISDRSDAHAVRESLRLGVSDYLISPIAPERFLQSLRQVGEYGRLAAAGLAQAEVDQLRSLSMPARVWVPRELSAERLSFVRRFVRHTEPPVSAASAARELGVSRVTARRYLEFLVATGELDEFACSGDRRGRPSKMYAPRVLLANQNVERSAAVT